MSLSVVLTSRDSKITDLFRFAQIYSASRRSYFLTNVHCIKLCCLVWDAKQSYVYYLITHFRALCPLAIFFIFVHSQMCFPVLFNLIETIKKQIGSHLEQIQLMFLINTIRRIKFHENHYCSNGLHPSSLNKMTIKRQ